MNPRKDRAQYGQAIGILTLDTRFPRIPGDAGNASSYGFPVRLKTVKRATIQRAMRDADVTLIEPFLKAARELEEEGVRAITTTCGFLSIFQKQLASQLHVPVFTSTLMLVPLVYNMLGKDQKVGIITADSSSLSDKHLKGAGIVSIPIAIEGLQNTKEFAGRVDGDKPTFDPKRVELEVVKVAKDLVKKNPNVGAIVFECANLPPYSRAVHAAVQLPVFDINHFITFIYNAVIVQERFAKGFL